MRVQLVQDMLSLRLFLRFLHVTLHVLLHVFLCLQLFLSQRLDGGTIGSSGYNVSQGFANHGVATKVCFSFFKSFSHIGTTENFFFSSANDFKRLYSLSGLCFGNCVDGLHCSVFLEGLIHSE
ncbi:hypothetical protein D3C71_1471300 [compost metagenome]